MDRITLPRAEASAPAHAHSPGDWPAPGLEPVGPAATRRALAARIAKRLIHATDKRGLVASSAARVHCGTVRAAPAVLVADDADEVGIVTEPPRLVAELVPVRASRVMAWLDLGVGEVWLLGVNGGIRLRRNRRPAELPDAPLVPGTRIRVDIAGAWDGIG